MGSFEFQASDEGGDSEEAVEKFKNGRALALYSPFTFCLAAGTLDPSLLFIAFLKMSTFFRLLLMRKPPSSVYEFAEQYEDDDEDKEAISGLRKRILKRFKKQDSLIHEWGFEPPKDRTYDAATVKYKEFLAETASGKVEEEKLSVEIVTPFEKTKVAAYTLSVISPCMRLYSFVSKEIQAHLDPDDGAHLQEASASRIGDLLNKLSISLTSEELDVVERLYRRAMKLELDFIWAQSIVQQSMVPCSRLLNNVENNLILFCDFELTCTAIDSSALLAELAIITTTYGSGPMPFANIRTTWNDLFTQYVEEYQQCVESIIPDEAGIDKYLQAEGMDYEGLYKALKKISDFEKRANARPIHSNVLKGLNLLDIKRAGERLEFQDGCKILFHDVVENKNCSAKVHVLSYCWCGHLIIRSAFSSGNLNALNVHSNDLVYQESVSTGGMIMKVECPIYKLQAFNTLQARIVIGP